MNLLIYGTGFIGSALARRLGGEHASGVHQIRFGRCRLEHANELLGEIGRSDADWVINAAGRCGTPNVSWCETHQPQTLLSNVIGAYNLAAACDNARRRLAHIGSGCLYEGDANGPGFTETDPPNFLGSFYSRTKGWAEQLLADFPDVLQLRIRLPIDDRPHPRNLITKLLSFPRVITGVRNSVTPLDLLASALDHLMRQEENGLYHVVADGGIDYKQLLQLWRQIVDPQLPEPQYIDARELTDVPRSNCVLSCDKLKASGFPVPKVAHAITQAFEMAVTNAVAYPRLDHIREP